MLQKESNIKVTDNSGAKIVKIIGILGSKKKFYTIGDIVKVSVKKRYKNNLIKKGKISNALIIRVKKYFKRIDGSYISFGDNACILLNSKNEMRGTRIIGPVPRELIIKKYKKMFFVSKSIY
ncbi:MAG: 50S ribosomal protein L14 [Candidatus Shikimatogenerans sp. AspAUS03]|uniref:Large ribosomal subunit protein uL14 n=1 Tax=Candidatus Shikimatogenerans sp. AspAUS03 TaxID=3158563 RepID=A0AAU7QS52_9FLAO